jgi:hypothetical protein
MATATLNELLRGRLSGRLDELPPLGIVVKARFAVLELFVVVALKLARYALRLLLNLIPDAHIHIGPAGIAYLAVSLIKLEQWTVVLICVRLLRLQ